MTLNHTCTGTNLVLFVAVETNAAGSPDLITGVTYNGVSMSLVVKQLDDIGQSMIYLFALINPATGTNTISVTASSTLDVISTSALSLTGCKQSGDPDNSTGANAFAASVSSALTTTDDNSWVVAAGSGVTTNASASTNVTPASTDGANPVIGYFGPQTPAGAVTMAFTSGGGNDHMYMVMASVPPAGGALPAVPLGWKGCYPTVVARRRR